MIRAIGAIAVFLAIVLLGEVVYQCFLGLDVQGNDFTQALPWLAAIGVFSVSYIWLVSRARSSQEIWRAVAIGITTSLLSRLIWVGLFDSQLGSDFRSYWFCADSLHLGLFGGPRSMGCRSIYFVRTLLYTYPIQRLFGMSPSALELSNVAILTGASLVWFLTGRRVIGEKPAAYSLLVLFFHPEVWYSVTIATNDVPAILAIALFFYTVIRFFEAFDHRTSLPIILFRVVCLSSSFLYLQWIRSFGAPFLVGFLLVIAYSCLKRIRGREGMPSQKKFLGSIMLFLCTLVVSYQISSPLLQRVTGFDPGGGIGLLDYFSSMDVFTYNRYSTMRPWRVDYLPQIPPERQTAYSIEKLLHEYSGDLRETVQFLYRKQKVLVLPDGYFKFSVLKPYDPWIKSTNNAQYGAQRYLMRIVLGTFALLGLLRLFLAPIIRFREGEAFLFIVTLSTYCMILLLTEAQPRYDTFTVFALSWLVGIAVATPSEWRANRPKNGVARVIACDHMSGVIGLTLGLALVAATLGFIQRSGRALTNQAGFTTVRDGDQITSIYENNFKRLRLGYPPSREIPPQSELVAHKMFGRPPRMHSMEFFVSTGQLRSNIKPFEQADIQFQVLINNKEVAAGALNDLNLAKYYYLSADQVPPGDTLDIEIHAINRNAIEPLNPRSVGLGAITFELLRIK